uniref:Uncharacterized protein n=1 Tax=Oryza meridionalis TaxID=40149 RepID=A0A0E0EFG1_9ORYZ
MSLVGQLGGAAGGVFSYFLAIRGPESNAGVGLVVLSRTEAVPVGAVLVPLVRNNQASSFYIWGRYANFSLRREKRRKREGDDVDYPEI